MPNARRRDTFITVEQLRQLRDMKCDTICKSEARDLFMLTYYLAGMNWADLSVYKFKNLDTISYIRTKTKNSKNLDKITKFSIPDEAKPIILSHLGKDKMIHLKCTINSVYHTYIKLAKDLSINHQFTLYSARKSFVQHGYELGIPLST